MTTETTPRTAETVEPQPVAAVEAPVAEQTIPAATPETAPAAPAAPAAVTPVPSATPAAPPGVDPRVAEYIAGLERQNRETQARLSQEAAVTSIARRQEALIADGLAPERAQAIATEIVQATQQAQSQVAEIRAKADYAGLLADQYKVSIRALMQYDTPEAMRQAVERLAADSQIAAENARLKAELASLKKGQVPSQTFESGRGAGGPVATAENIDKLYMDWERANVGSKQKNPYEDAYRRVIQG